MEFQDLRFAPEGLVDDGAVLAGRDLLVRAGEVVGQVARDTVTPGYRPVAVASLLAPALVDIHTHGAFGVAFDDPALDAEAMDRLRTSLMARGIAAFVASLPSLGPDHLVRQLDRLAAWANRVEPGRATLLGVHLEGPYLSPARRGAHAPENLRRLDAVELGGWLDRHPGLVRMITLATDESGGDDLVALAQARGVVAALGHSDATADEAEHAMALGARHATHLWNAMPPLLHREPGLVGALLAHPTATVELICDGHHLDRRVALLTVRAVGPERVVLVTDSMAAAGLGDGVYRLGDLEATVKDGVARLPSGVLAGSTLLLDVAVHNVVAWGAADAVRAHAMASTTPARVIGARPFGRLWPAARAALVTLGEDGTVRPLHTGA